MLCLIGGGLAALVSFILNLIMILATGIPMPLALRRAVHVSALMPGLILGTLALRISLGAALVLPLDTLAVIAVTPLKFRFLLFGPLFLRSLLLSLGFVCILRAFGLIFASSHSVTSSYI